MEIITNNKKYELYTDIGCKCLCEKCAFGTITGECESENAARLCGVGDTYFVPCEGNEIITEEKEELHIGDVMNWVEFAERKPDEDDTYYVFPYKHHYTAEYHKYGKWAGKWTVDDRNGYECEVHVDYWKAIIPPCL